VIGASCWLILGCGSRSGLLLGNEPATDGSGAAGGVGGNAGLDAGSGSGGSGSGGFDAGSGGFVDAGSTLCPPGSAPVVLASGLETGDAYGIALDESFVYFTRAPFNGSGAVARVPKLGGPVESLSASESRPRNLVVDAEHVFFTSPLSGQVKRVRKNGTELTVLADGQHTPEGIALAGADVYWVQGSSLDGKLMQLDLTGGASQVLVDHINSTWALELKGGWLYYTAGSTSTQVSPRIQRFHQSWPPGTAPELVALLELGTDDISADDTHVYFTNNVALGRVPLLGGSAEILFDGGYFVRGVDATSEHVYFVESAGAGDAEGTVYRYSKASGEIIAVASGQHLPRRVVADQECLYWTNSGFGGGGGAVMRGPL
jgi:hypothetical protein